WLRQNVAAGTKVGFDPWLHTIADARAVREALAQVDAELVPLAYNLIDSVWTDRPELPLGAVKIHPLTYAGVSAAEKIETIGEALARAKVNYTVLTDPSSIAWAFNIRGNDVPHTPLALSFAI